MAPTDLYHHLNLMHEYMDNARDGFRTSHWARVNAALSAAQALWETVNLDDRKDPDAKQTSRRLSKLERDFEASSRLTPWPR